MRWATLRRRFWLNTPRDPKTGEPRAKLFWWLVPGILLTYLIMEGLGGLSWPKIPSACPASHEEHESEYDESFVVGKSANGVTTHGTFSVI